MSEAKAIAAKLGEPFDVAEVKFKPAMVKGERALAMAYVDARVIQDRLDEAAGVENWQDKYTVRDSGSVVCTLSIRFGSEWITKEDVGSLSEQPDAGDQLKAAFSDALKRAAVKFGVGRYLYRIPSQWFDYDTNKKQFKTKPTLPAWAIPKGGEVAGTALADQLKKLAGTACKEAGYDLAKWSTEIRERYKVSGELANIEKRIVRLMIDDVNKWISKIAATPKGAAVAPDDAKPAGGSTPIENGVALYQKLRDYELKLIEAQQCKPGGLVAHVVGLGKTNGFPPSMNDWKPEHIAKARQWVTEFAQKAAAGFPNDRKAAADSAKMKQLPPANPNVENDDDGNPIFPNGPDDGAINDYGPSEY